MVCVKHHAPYQRSITLFYRQALLTRANSIRNKEAAAARIAECADAAPEVHTPLKWPVFEPWPEPADDILRLHDWISFQSEVSSHLAFLRRSYLPYLTNNTLFIAQLRCIRVRSNCWVYGGSCYCWWVSLPLKTKSKILRC